MTLCPEAEYRASLSDAEFWEHVLLGGVQVEDDYDPDSDPNCPPETPMACDEWGTCPLCGETGACAFDVNGDPMRHVTSDREDS